MIKRSMLSVCKDIVCSESLIRRILKYYFDKANFSRYETCFIAASATSMLCQHNLSLVVREVEGNLRSIDRII